MSKIVSHSQRHVKTSLQNDMDKRRWTILLLIMICIVAVQACGHSSSPPPAPKPVPVYPPTFSSCPTDIYVTAPPGKTSVTVTWKKPSVAKDGKSVILKQVNGPTSGSLFHEGPAVRISYQAYEHPTKPRAYCSFFVTVRVLYCPDLPYLQHGTRSCSGKWWNMYGSECQHRCNSGYMLKGAQILKCGSNERWDKAPPTCESVSCGAPGAIADGLPTCYMGYDYPQMCIITCNDGYRPSGAPFIICQATGTWSTALPCVDTQGPSFPNGCPDNQQLDSGPLRSPVAVSWSDPVTTDNSGQPVTLTSDPARGSLLGPGFYVIRITARDISGNTASCNFIVRIQARTCSSLLAPANGIVTCTSGYVEGSECTVTCNQGYDLQGQSVLTCLQTKQWNSSPPSCVAATCPLLPSVQYGSFQCDSGQTYLAVCTLVCGEGSTVQGSHYIQCGTGGNWITPGSCEDIQSPVFPDGCPQNVELYAARLGQPTLVQWKMPRVTDNSALNIQLVSDIQSGSNFSMGVTHVTYTATDVSGNTAICSFTVTVNVAVCPMPDLEPANKTSTFMVYSCPDGYVFGAACRLNCTHGYPLIGSDTITCERDDRTYPPTMSWDWSGPSAVKPMCEEIQCPDLAPPENGALSCLRGNFGYDCLMSCQEPYDVPAVQFRQGHFYCVGTGSWTPSFVPGCVVTVRANAARMHSDLFYYADNCNTSLDVIKENFITRMNSSAILQDACVGVPTCVVENVQVTCAALAGRRKRSVRKTLTLLGSRSGSRSRVKRQTGGSHYMLIGFEVYIELQQNSSQTSQDIMQQYEAVKTEIYDSMVAHAANGSFDIDGLNLDDMPVGFPRLSADCPAGTKSALSNTFSCVGCSKGYFMLPNLTCEACPVGSYTELDNATSCTACPSGLSTLTTASHNESSCKDLCPAGSVSPDGFVPCQPCPRGQYQPRSASTTCDLCPTNTWTEDTGASSSQQCVPADVTLTNSSLTGQILGQWSVLTVSLWVRLPANSSMAVSLSSSENGSLLASYSLSSSDVDESAQTQNSGGTPSNSSAVGRILPEIWSRLMFIAAVNDQLILTSLPPNATTLSVDPNVSDLTILTVHTDNERVFVSGLLAVGQTPTEAEINAAPTSCTGNRSDNLLSWLPSSNSVSTPSVCDAVNECLPNPCGGHGVCENLLADFLCQCQDGWSGATCDVPPEPCYQHQCRNGATCVSDASNYTCTCPQGFVGDMCADVIVDGGWGEWSLWSDCSATCRGQEQRQRQCNNPAPQHGGSSCVGEDTQSQTCGATVCIANGTWSNWTTWSPCSTTCGGGETTRQRTCENPGNSSEVVVCVGDSSQTEACNTSAILCPVHGGWSAWAEWSSCSVTCGDGVQSRDRSCDNPVPTDGGDECSGPSSENQTCSVAACPACSPLERPSRGLWTCTDTESPQLRNCTFACLPGFVVAMKPPPFTCGLETSYLWNHQRDHDSASAAPMPECTEPYAIRKASYTLTATMNTGCDISAETAVADGIPQNLDSSVPCLLQGLCSQQVSTNCDSPTRKRSTPALQVVLEFFLNPNLGPNQILQDNTLVASYQQLFDVVGQSLLLENQTEALLTVSLGGQTVTPDMTSVVSSIGIVCPDGMISVDIYCAPCPAGSREESGQCQLCPLGQYQDQPASTSCKPCPNDFTSDLIGAYDVALCRFPQGRGVSAGPHPRLEGDGDHLERKYMIIIVTSIVGLLLIVGVITGFCMWNRGAEARNRRRPPTAWGSRRSIRSVGIMMPETPTLPYPVAIELLPPLPPLSTGLIEDKSKN